VGAEIVSSTSPSIAGSAVDAAIVAVPDTRATWWQRAGLYVLLGELIVLYAPTAKFLWERWTMSVWHNAHGLLVPPVVAYLIYQELKRFDGPAPRSSAWGFAWLVPAMLLQAFDAGMHTQLLSAASIIIALPGLSLLFLGVERTRAIAFPLAFLLAALPIPLGMTEQIHMQLRVIATVASGWLVPLLGIPTYAEGTTLHIPPGTLQISDACSGFSTLYAAAAVACLTAHSAPTMGRKALVLLTAAPLAIAANIIRIILLVLLIMWQGAWVLDSFLHPLSGMMTFAISLPIIFWLGGDPNSVRPRSNA
jgi:exosortase